MDIVAISMDPKERAEKAKGEWEIENLPIGYELSLLTARAYGLFISDAISDKEPAHFSEPGIFVVRPDGTLYAQYLQNTPFARPPMKDILSGLKFAVEKDYPVRGASVI